MGKYFKDDTLSLISSLIGLGRALENESRVDEEIEKLLFKAVEEISRDTPEKGEKERVIEAKRQVVPSCFVCTHPCGHNDDYQMDRIEELDNERTKEIFSLLTRIPEDGRKYYLVIKSLIYISSDFEDRFISSLMGELSSSLPSI